MESLASGYILSDDVLVRTWFPCDDCNVNDPVLQIVVPDQVGEVVLDTAHGDIVGHMGVHPVVVYSDHHPLTFLHLLQSPSQRPMWWTLFRQPDDLCIRHICGVDVIADALSRAPEGIG